MPANKILQYLKKHGEQLDTEIADAIGITLTSTRSYLSELSGKGEVISCHTIRFVKGKKIEGLSCRLAGITPKAAPGRKSKVQSKLS
jgi:DNA-binding IclR family transcriptional regulator